MRPTIKKIVNLLEEFVDNHQQLRDFGYGDIAQINTKERLMPTMWADLITSRVTRNAVYLGVRVYAMDLVATDDENELDVHSDSILYLQDLVKTLRTNSRLIGEEDDFTFTPFQKKFNDRVAGWYVDLQFEVDSIYGPCDIPTLNSSSLNVISETATGVGVENLDVAGLLKVNGTYVFNRNFEQNVSTNARVDFTEVEAESYRLNRTYITGSYTATTSNHLIGVDTTSGSVTLTLPSASSGEYEFIIKDEGFNFAVNNLIVDSVDSNDKFEDNETELTFSTDGTSVTIYSNGNNKYYIV